MTTTTPGHAPAMTPHPTGAYDDVVWFADIGRDDVLRVGGKGANLGELTRAGFPVPPGFVVAAGAYLRAMDAGGVRASLLRAPDTGSLDAAAAAQRQAAVRSAGMPEDL